MPKALATEEALRAIHAIRQAPEQFDLQRDLGSFLRHKSNHVIAAAADTVKRLEAGGLVQELSDAFLELMKDPAKRDQGCKALIAIATALASMDCAAPRVYFAGIRHVQKEGSFGPPVDVAAPLRGLCAQGLARSSHPDALLYCVTVLADPEIPARSGAIRAIAESGRPDGILLLRFKALIGDKEEEIVAECFAGLLRLDPAGSLEFVGAFLRTGSDDTRSAAALALGESRLAAAFAVLRDAWDHTAEPALRKNLLLSIAMLRDDQALDFLFAKLAEDSERSAAPVLVALALYARDATVRERVEAVLRKRNSAALQAVYVQEFR